jgi:hypothetical protein
VSTSRLYSIKVNPVEQRRLEEELGLLAVCRLTVVTEPQIREKDNAIWETKGDYNSITREIRVMVGMTWLQRTALPLVRSSLVYTLLHEFRHAHQYDHWAQFQIDNAHAVHYGMSELEKDANDFAALRRAAYSNLVRLSLRKPKSYDFGHGPRGFAKLSAAS